MKPQLKLDGWVTRDSDGYIKFHTSEPYPIDKKETNYRDAAKPLVSLERIWASRERSFYITQDNDDSFPAELEDEPRKATIELWME